MTDRKTYVAAALKMKPYLQSAGLCGPASLVIMAGHFGRKHTEKEIAKLCDVDPNIGTDHAPLVRAARRIGAHVYEKSEATVADLRRLVHQERLPVMVGWWAGPHRTETQVKADHEQDMGHYSVAYRLTDSHLYLMDPDLVRGRRRMDLEPFEDKWYDMDEGYVLVRRWLLAINFDGRKFSRRLGGKDGPPL